MNYNTATKLSSLFIKIFFKSSISCQSLDQQLQKHPDCYAKFAPVANNILVQKQSNSNDTNCINMLSSKVTEISNLLNGSEIDVCYFLSTCLSVLRNVKYLNPLKSVLLVLVLIACSLSNANGQRQPKIQKISILAPFNIKIDGELKEWEDKNLNAYNNLNKIYYAISNDDQNLYLTVRGSEPAVGSKILKEGIKFTISHSLEKSKKNKDPKNVSITFPSRIPDARAISFYMSPNLKIKDLIKDTIKNKVQIDSLTAIANKRVESIAKEINIQGIKEINEPVLSIYNNVGIKAAIHFLKGEPIIELAIPLKYLDLTFDALIPFSYNIKLSGPPITGDFDISAIQKSGTPTEAIPEDDLYRMIDTELWGEYVLAKKKP